MASDFERKVMQIERMARMRNYDSAIYLCNSLIKNYEHLAASWSKRAFVFGLAGNHDAAIRDAERAIALAPTEPCYYWDHGCYSLEMFDFERAITSFTQALNLGKSASDSYYLEASYLLRAEAYSRMGDFYNAVQDCEHVRDDALLWIGKVKVSKKGVLARCQQLGGLPEN